MKVLISFPAYTQRGSAVSITAALSWLLLALLVHYHGDCLHYWCIIIAAANIIGALS